MSKSSPTAFSQPLRRSARQKALVARFTQPQRPSPLRRRTSSSLKASSVDSSPRKLQAPARASAAQTRIGRRKKSAGSLPAPQNAPDDVLPSSKGQGLKDFSVDAPKLTLEKLREWEQTTTKDPTLPPPLRTESETWSYIWRAKSGSKRRFAESESKASEAESDPAGSRTITTAKRGSSDDKTIPLTDPQFSKMARENGILSMIGSREPSNIMDICAILETGRNSPTPGQTEFAAFRSDVEISGNEISVGVVVLSILKRCDLPYKRALNQPFTKFPSKVGFNDGLSVAKPDLVEGYFAPAFKPYDFERPVGDSAIPTQCEYPIAMSHLTGDFKKLGGDFRCGQHQAAYNAAFLVYARDQAGIAVNGPDKVDAAFVGSFICDGERLQISVHYSSKDSSGKTVYHQTPVFDRNIRMNRASFTDGRKHLRNLQDWAQENANEIRLALIAHDMQSDSDALDESIVGGPRKVISPVSMDDKTVKK